MLDSKVEIHIYEQVFQQQHTAKKNKTAQSLSRFMRPAQTVRRPGAPTDTGQCSEVTKYRIPTIHNAQPISISDLFVLILLPHSMLPRHVHTRHNRGVAASLLSAASWGQL